MTPRRKAWLIAGAVLLIPLGGAAVVTEAWFSANAHLRRERGRVDLELAALKEHASFNSISAHDLKLQARACAGEGETDLGIDLMAKFWDLGDADSRGALDDFKSVLVGVRDGLDALEDYLRTADLNREQLDRLAGLLENVQIGPNLLWATFRVTGLECSLDLFSELDNPESPLHPLTFQPGFSDLFSTTIAASKMLGRMDAYLKGVSERLKLKGRARRAAIEGWTVQCFGEVNFLNWKAFVPETQDLLKAEANASINLQLARVAVAIRRFHLEHGSAPPTLEALVPSYLKSVPEDPYLGAPFKYTFDGLLAKVYSLGWDGDDDGGRDIEECYEDGDFVWVVRVHAPE